MFIKKSLLDRVPVLTCSASKDLPGCRTNSEQTARFKGDDTLVPEVFLDFLRERDQEQAVKPRKQAAKATMRERKTSGYLDLKSHFHSDDSCQTRQIANKKSDQWQFNKQVPISRYFFKWGQTWGNYVMNKTLRSQRTLRRRGCGTN